MRFLIGDPSLDENSSEGLGWVTASKKCRHLACWKRPTRWHKTANVNQAATRQGLRTQLLLRRSSSSDNSSTDTRAAAPQQHGPLLSGSKEIPPGVLTPGPVQGTRRALRRR